MNIRFAFCFCLQCVLFAHICFAQNIEQETLSKYIGTGNAGTEFYISFPPCYEITPQDAGNKFLLQIFSPITQKVFIKIEGKNYSDSLLVNAYKTYYVELARDLGQPYIKVNTDKAPVEQVYAKAGINITSSTPVVVYALNRFNNSSEGFLALPVSRLGTDYMVASWSQHTATNGFMLPSHTNIVAAYDNTKVTFTMGGSVGARTRGGLTMGQSKSWNLQKGDVLCFANDSLEHDLSGSRVVADKPIGVVSGNECANVPKTYNGCDFICEMEIPVTSWGKEYHMTPIGGRNFNPIVRVYAHPDYKNVTVNLDGEKWFVLPNLIEVEGHRFLEMRVTTGAPKATTISSDAPIFVSMYSTKESASSNPMQSAIIPTEQFRKEVFFSSPPSRHIPPADSNFVNIVYALDNNGEMRKDLEFGTMVYTNSQFDSIKWTSVEKKFGKYIGWKYAKKSINGEQYAMKRIGVPPSELYVIRSSKPLAVYLYTEASAESYALPAGCNLVNFSEIDTTPPLIAVTDSSLIHWSGTVADFMAKKSEKKSDIIANTVPGHIASLSNVKEYDKNIKFEQWTVGNEMTSTRKWKISILDSIKEARCVLVAADKAGNSIYKDYVYKPDTGKVIITSPPKISLNIAKDKSVQTFLTIKNTNKYLSVIITKHSFNGTYLTINSDGINNRTIKPGDSIQVPLNFFAQVRGKFTGKFTCTSNLFGTTELTFAAEAMEGVLATIEDITFNTTDIGSISTETKHIGLSVANVEFADKVTIVKVQCKPENSIAFTTETFGNNGFQIDTSLFINKELIPGEAEMQIPVRFKALNEGMHTANLQLYTSDEKFKEVRFTGYGRAATSVEEDESNGTITVYASADYSVLNIINNNAANEHSFSIYNQLGEKVLLGIIPSGNGSYTIPVSMLQNGMYIFSTEINGKRVQEKFIIIR